MDINHKTKIAVDRINAAFSLNSRVITGHSGGKDSVVIHDLVNKSAGTRFAIVHNVKPLLGTSGDPVAALTEMHSETLDFLYTDVCRNNNVQFMHSSMMPQYIAQNKIDCQIDGSRLCEYTREGKSSEFIINGEKVSRKHMTEYIANGIFGLNMSYPIYDWSDDDVFEYIHVNKLTLSEEYVKNGELQAFRNKWQKA